MPNVPVTPPNAERCQHCISNLRRDSLGTLRSVKDGVLTERFCPGMPAVPHKLLPIVSAHA